MELVEPAAGSRAGSEPRERLPSWAVTVLLAALLFGSVLRLAGVGAQALGGDEPNALPTVNAGTVSVLTTFDGRGSHPGFSLLQRVALDVLGESPFAYRLPAILAGLLALFAFYPIGSRLVGPRSAWLATLVLSVSSIHVYYSRAGRPYALAFLMMALLAAALCAAVRGRRRAWPAVAVLAGLLPWVHLTSIAPLLALALVALASSWRERPARRRCLLAFASGAALTVLLYLPAWQGLLAYYEKLGRERTPHAHWWLVLEVLGGTSFGGPAILVGGLAGGVCLARRAGREGLLLLAAVLATLASVVFLRPKGAQLAFARYLLIVLPMLLWLAAFSWFRLVSWARLPSWVGLAAGLAFGVYQLLAGPMDPSWFHGTFTSMPDLLLRDPARDVEVAGTPEIYRSIASSPSDLCLVEYPVPLYALLLLRNYELHHGKRVLAGRDDGDRFSLRTLPYVSIRDPESLRAVADWLIVHLDIRQEIHAFQAAAGLPRWRLVPLDLNPSVQRMIAVFGEPTFRSEQVLAWHLTDP